MKKHPKKLEISKYNRLIVYQSTWSWYNGKANGSCLFSSKEEAIRFARFHAQSTDWDNFPDESNNYPYEDRDGANDLNPLFRVSWDSELNGKGHCEVNKLEICDVFNWYAVNGLEEPLNWDRTNTGQRSVAS